jgi:hypothetical protein
MPVADEALFYVPSISQSSVTHPHKPWNWTEINLNPGITMEDIVNYSDYPWSWDNISQNLFTYSSRMQALAIKKLKHALVGVRAKRLIDSKRILCYTEICNDLINTVLCSLQA